MNNVINSLFINLFFVFQIFLMQLRIFNFFVLKHNVREINYKYFST